MINLFDYKKFHDRLSKKEQVSKLEMIYNEYNPFKDNVIRRPKGQCLGNLNYANVRYDYKTGRYYRKDFNLAYKKFFMISDEWKDRVRSFIIWNYGFGKYFPYNEFVDAMVYDYCRFGRKSIPYSQKVLEAEEKCVRYYVRNEIDKMNELGYILYREEFKKERPEYFIGEERRVFRCLDMNLTKGEKISACFKHKKRLKDNIFDNFVRLIKKCFSTLYTWFDSRIDNEGFERICFSEKSIRRLNNSLVRNGLREMKGTMLFREFCKRIKYLSGDPRYSINKFIGEVALGALNKETIIKAIKKIKNEKVLKVFNGVFKFIKNYYYNLICQKVSFQANIPPKEANPPLAC